MIYDNMQRAAHADTHSMFDQERMQETARLNDLLRFARGLEVTEEVAIAVYECELQQLRQGATVQRYVSLIAEKRAKQVLRARRR